MISVNAIWLATEPLEMRAGTETSLVRLVTVFGVARPLHTYCFANRRVSRMKVLVHDGGGVWQAARRLNRGEFVWADALRGPNGAVDGEQWQAQVLGVLWQHVGSAGAILVFVTPDNPARRQ